MTITVKFTCESCQAKNKSNMGMPGYKWIIDEWESLTGALDHQNNYPKHFIEATVEIEVSVS